MRAEDGTKESLKVGKEYKDLRAEDVLKESLKVGKE